MEELLQQLAGKLGIATRFSDGGLVLMAKEGIRLESMTGIAMQGMSDIMALYSEGASSL